MYLSVFVILIVHRCGSQGTIGESGFQVVEQAGVIERKTDTESGIQKSVCIKLSRISLFSHYINR